MTEYVKVGAQYAPQDGKIASTPFLHQPDGRGCRDRKATYEESIGWYAGITADMFG
jgi:sulfide dehydrogenase [flavocytochrome c] flavoprotein subunit